VLSLDTQDPSSDHARQAHDRSDLYTENNTVRCCTISSGLVGPVFFDSLRTWLTYGSGMEVVFRSGSRNIVGLCSFSLILTVQRTAIRFKSLSTWRQQTGIWRQELSPVCPLAKIDCAPSDKRNPSRNTSDTAVTPTSTPQCITTYMSWSIVRSGAASLQPIRRWRHCYIRDIRRNRNTIDQTTACTIATSLIHSKIDYCNSLLLNLPAIHKRIVFNLSWTLLLVLSPKLLNFITLLIF